MITKLIAENFKRLVAVTIEPNGGAVTIAGNNDQGKSSTLDAIEAALGGGKRCPSEPIKRGAKKARVVLETEDLVVTRKWTSKSSTLEVTGKDGARFTSPQGMLDELVGPLSFDPLDFTRKKPPEQAKILRELVGLDLSKEDAARKEAYDERTLVGREIKRLQGAVESIPEAPTGSGRSVSELTEELQRRREANANNAAKRAELERMRSAAVERQSACERLEKQIAGLNESLAVVQRELAELSEKGPELSKEVKALKDEDTEEILEELKQAEQIAAAAARAAERNRMQAELDAKIEESERLTNRINEIDQVKSDAIAKARYPIDGLEVTDDGVRLDGLPFEQASQSDRLKASVAIGLALNPKLKVLLVRDGSLLDDAKLGLISEMAEQAGAQVWLEVVGEREGATVVIEDGGAKTAEVAKAS